jgi:hypothetical protein
MFEAYKIGVKLSLVDGITSGLMALSGHFRTLSKEVDGVQGRLNRLKAQGAISAAAAGVGLSIFAAMRPAVEAANEYQQQLARLGAMGFGDAVTNQAAKAAAAMRVMGASIIQTTEAMRDALAITPALADARILAPTLARVPFAARMYGISAGAAQSDALNMLRAAEQREGMEHPHQILKAANEFWQMAAFSGFRIKGSDFRGLSATGSTAFKLLSDAGLRNLEPALQEMGGHRVGTGLMSAYTNLAMGRMMVGNSQVIQTLQGLGLLDLHHVIRNKSGKISRLAPGGILGTKMLESDPYEWLKTVFLPAAMKHGYTTLRQQMNLMPQIMSNRRGATLMSILLQNLEAIQAKAAQIKKTDTIDEAAKRYGKTAAGKWEAAKRAWTTAEVGFGIHALPFLAKALTSLTGIIERLTGWMDTHKTGTKIFVDTLIGLAAALTAGGVIGLTTTALRALWMVFPILSGAVTAAAAPLGEFALALAFRGVGGAAGIATLAGSLGTVGGQLKLVAGAAAIFLSYELGKKAGSWIYNHMSRHAQDDVGGAIAHVLAALGDKDAQQAIADHRKYDGANVQHETHVHVNFDGEEIRHFIMRGHAPTLPARGPQGLNPLHSPVSPGLNYAPGL